MIAKREASQTILQAEAGDGRTTTRSGTFQARVTEIDLLDAGGRSARGFTVGDRARVRALIAFSATISCRRVKAWKDSSGEARRAR